MQTKTMIIVLYSLLYWKLKHFWAKIKHANGEVSIVSDADSSVKAKYKFSLICGSLANMFLRVNLDSPYTYDTDEWKW